MPDEKRSGPRVEAEIALRLAYGSIDEFIERYALNISSGGIFVRSRDPLPPGSPVRFDLQLASGQRVVRGTGVVTWITPPSAPGEPKRLPGMGITFTSLDPESRALVERVVAARGADALVDGPPRPSEGSGGGGDPGRVAPDSDALPVPAAPARPASRRVIGIDLGTTNSCAAVAEGPGARMLASKLGHATVPSVVAYDVHGRLLVGQPAKAQTVTNPRNTVYGSKRLVGRPFASPTVQACRDRFPYEVVEGADGSAAVRFAGRVFSLQHIAAHVLAEIRELASEALGEEVTRAVVTVPAYYNDHQRQAVREAGALANLEVVRIVNEPTAAALAFGFGKGLDERVLVYDLGGGTFDASVLEIQGDVYEVVSTGGDTFLGGVDFDDRVVDHLVAAFTRENGFAPPDDLAVWQRLRDAAEETKVALSSVESTVARVTHLCKAPDGREADLNVTVTRGELEQLTRGLVDRTLEVCKEVLAAKGLTRDDVDEILLVGGQSRMPLVWGRTREELGKEPSRAVHPDEAVAIGAALLGDAEARIDSVVLLDVLAMGIGVGLPGGRVAPVLARNTRLPARRTYEAAIPAPGQDGVVELAVFQGDAGLVTECEYLGTVRLEGFRPAPGEDARVSVDFALGNEGILSVSARDVATGRITAVQLATMDTPASLRRKLQLEGEPVPPPGARPIEAAAGAVAATAARPEGDGVHHPPPAPRVAGAAPPPEKKRSLFARLFGR